MTAARANNLNVFLGTLLISTYEADVQKLVTALNGDWSNVDAVAIGNEALLSGDSKSAQQNVDAVNAARTTGKPSIPPLQSNRNLSITRKSLDAWHFGRTHHHSLHARFCWIGSAAAKQIEQTCH